MFIEHIAQSMHTPMNSRSLLRTWSTVILLALLSALVGHLHAETRFTDPNFVIDILHQGNGMISMDFDDAGNLYVNEKQGRVLKFPRNPNADPSFNISYQYYTGTWTTMPDFSTLTPVKTGTLNDFLLTPATQNDFYAFRYTANLPITSAGNYTFYLNSDDGSMLYVDDVLVVDHNGTHGDGTTKTGTINLSAGTHTLRVEYFENAGGNSLRVRFSKGTEIPEQSIGKYFGPYLPPVEFLNVVSSVYTQGESGMMGLALDPDYANNRFFYVFYTTSADQKLVRYTALPDFSAADTSTALTLLSGLPRTGNVHKSGDIGFHPNEPHNLYIMVGDDGHRELVTDLTKYNGKILRIDSTTGQGISTNPYFNSAQNAGNPNSVEAKVWSARYRNAFRFCFDPAAPFADTLYISENGDGTDRLARIMKGADGGWDNAFTTSSSGSPAARTILRTSSPSVVGVTIVRGGPFAPSGPVIYQARYGEMERFNLTGTYLDALTPIATDTTAGKPFLYDTNNNFSFILADIMMGPDGCMYFTDSGQGSSTGTGFQLSRIRHVGGTPPDAAFNASTTSGVLPLTVNFTDASAAPGSTLATWNWDFGDGTGSTIANPSHTYTQPGIYTVRLTVTNLLGLQDSTTQVITAYRAVNLALTGLVHDARTLSGGGWPGATELRFYQADGVTPIPLEDGLGAQGNGVAIPAGGVINESVALALTSHGLVISAGEPDSDGAEPAYVGLLLSTASDTPTREIDFYLAASMVRGRVIDTRGQPATTTIGLSLGAGLTAYTFPTDNPNRVQVDDLGYYHLPIRLPDANQPAVVDTEDTAVYAAVRASVYLPAHASRVRDFVVGLYNGGIGEDNLAGIAPTTNVDFTTQIQPIFDANCIGCHTDIATNSGGLDLRDVASLDELVSRFSTEARGVRLVDPGSPERSYLMEKISSAQPQVGTRMRPNDPMPLAQQALIRDWIAQLADSDQVRFTSAQFTQTEGEGVSVNAQIGVERVGTTGGAVSVTVSTVSDGSTATAGSDYTATSATLNWAAGVGGTQYVNLPILPDALSEGAETVNLALGAPINAVLGNTANAQLSILDRPYDAWRTDAFGPATANTAPAAPGADFEGDSVPNILEYALGGDPRVSDLGWLNGHARLDSAEAKFTFPWNFQATGVILRVLGTLSLEAGGAGWQELASHSGNGGAWTYQPGVLGLEPDPAAGTLELRLDPIALGSESQYYLKLEAISP